MNILAKTILERIFDGIDLAGATRRRGGGLVSRVAAAEIVRLVFRWPALSVVLLSIVAACVMSRR
ncbi:MAG TPA: hypothetical protein VKA83_17700, partial [Methylomirabilota bacterium]|nr:hypothetical protein [Methylomirabilota bacterium]